MRYNVIVPEKPKELNKSPWECKVKKRAKETHGKQMGQGCPEKTNGTQEPVSDVIKESIVILGHWEKNKRQAQRVLAGLRQTIS